MNISPVSFGKTVRVNMPEESVYELANLVNSRFAGRADRQLQKDAKAIFSDTYEGCAVVCSPDEGKSYYILSGLDASRLNNIRRKINENLELAASLYEEGPLLESHIRYIYKREKQEVNNLINGTKEGFILSKYEDEKSGVSRLRKLSVVG